MSRGHGDLVQPAGPALFHLPKAGPLDEVLHPEALLKPARKPVDEEPTRPLTADVPLREPALLDLPAGMAAEAEDEAWPPGTIRTRAATAGPLHWIAGGIATLLLGWLVLAATGFVQDQFARSATSGWVTLAVFGAGVAACGWGLWLEGRAYRGLRQVDALRVVLARDEGAIEPARRLTHEWLGRLDGLPDLTAARQAVATAPDMPLLRAALRTHLAGPLHEATRRIGNRAALEGGLVVAISPSPALDGLLAALRGLSLIRQVAALHGLRPGGAVTLALLRRLALTAAGTSGLGLLGQGLADTALTQLPVLRHLTAALPGAGLTALRLRRLAEVTAQACSPIADR